MKEPGRDHPIAIEEVGRTVRVVLGGQIVAESRRAVRLRESVYPPVYYFPREDVAMDLLDPTPKRTRCPYKGEASYFTVSGHGVERKDAAWSYETPAPAVAAIAGRIAFYRDRMDAIEELS